MPSVARVARPKPGASDPDTATTKRAPLGTPAPEREASCAGAQRPMAMGIVMVMVMAMGILMVMVMAMGR